jgi:hypothetical protein
MTKSDVSLNHNDTSGDKPVFTDRDRDLLQMVEDHIALKQAKREKVAPHLYSKRDELKAKLAGAAGGSYVYSEKVFGHPQATNLHPDRYGNLIPIKVNSPDAVRRFIERAQTRVDELQAKLGSTGRLDAVEETILSLLREETMPELNRMLKCFNSGKGKASADKHIMQTASYSPEQAVLPF